MGDWWIYPIAGVGIAFVMWIFGAEQKEDDDETARACGDPVYSHDPGGADRFGERRERVKHSGVIVSIAGDQTYALFPHLTVFGEARTFVLAELGPWQVRNGAMVITYQTITLAPETEFAMVARADAAPSGFGGDFVETRLGPEGVYLNDYVTIDCRHEGRHLVAVKITVTELPAAQTEGGIPR